MFYIFTEGRTAKGDFWSLWPNKYRPQDRMALCLANAGSQIAWNICIYENCHPRFHDMQACHKLRSQECWQHLSPIVLSFGGNVIVALISSLVTARTSPGKYFHLFDMSARLFRGLIGGKNNSLITTMMLLTFPCWRRQTWQSWTCRQRRPTHQTALRIIVWQYYCQLG